MSSEIAPFSPYWPRTTSSTFARRFPFQCADVLDVWLQTVGRWKNVAPVFVAVLDRTNAPLLLFPLCIERQNGFKILSFMDGDVSDYNAPVVFPAARDWDEAKAWLLWEELKRRLPAFDLALFEKIPQAVGDCPNPVRFLCDDAYCHSGHRMTLPADWDGAEKALLPDEYDSRRRLKKLRSRGEVCFSVAETEEEAHAYLKALMEMKGAQFLRTLGYDRFAYSPGYEKYYIEATNKLFGEGVLKIMALKLESRILAANWGYVVEGNFYALMAAYLNEPEWKPYAPGRLLNEYRMKWCSKQGLEALDLGVGDEPYKVRYADVHERLYEARLPMTAMGRVFDLARGAKDLAITRLEGTKFKEAIKDTVRGARTLVRKRSGSSSTRP